MRTRTFAVLTCLAVLLAGCGPTKRPTANGQATGAASTAPSAPASPAGSPVPVVKDIPAGNCTLYTKADAVKLMGGANGANKALNLPTAGGTRIDQCSYLYSPGMTSIQGITYAVVRYDSAATASAKVQQLQVAMLGSAASNNWPVQPLITPVPGAGQVRGGFGSKTEDGVTFTMAVIGTNVGPYLVAALGASTVSEANAKKYSLTVFQSLAASVG
jgi:hypothetical protein